MVGGSEIILEDSWLDPWLFVWIVRSGVAVLCDILWERYVLWLLQELNDHEWVDQLRMMMFGGESGAWGYVD